MYINSLFATVLALYLSISPTLASLTAKNFTTSTTGACGSDLTCISSQWGNCCSEDSFCGANSTYCGAGCQSDFGACYTNYTHISPESDGICGSTSASKYTCLGSIFGNCCSESGFCGANSTYCGTGCQGGYGVCGVSKAASASIATTVFGAAATASASASAVPSSSSSGLSTGAKIGIGVGVPLGAIVLLGFVAFFVLRRRKRNPRQKNNPSTGAYSAELPASSAAFPGGTKHDEKQYAKNVPHEMGTGDAVQFTELDGNSITEQERIARVDDRAAAGYDGAYRGN